MGVAKPKMDNVAPDTAPEVSVRALMRRAWKAALGTIDRTTGHPYASLVTVATEPDGTPLLLLSRLALHTRNLERDSRASLLIDGTSTGGNALAGDRATLIGSAALSQSATARARFLARHPSAAAYADFADFAFYRFQIERAHFIGGFGRIVELEPHELLVQTGDAEALIAAEPEFVSHWNEAQAGILELIATRVGNRPAGRWRLLGVDPDGLDLALGDSALRLSFGGRVRTADEASRAIMALAATARAAPGARF
jgi:putative heme iron utilization protein